MIGYSMYARRLYHKVKEDNDRWAKCDATAMDVHYNDDEEDALKRIEPKLSRCPKCWPKAGAA